MHSLELISNILCPYTQRAGIQLLEKQVPFTRTYIDLAAKPAWFEALSPLGKVPVLRVAEGAIFETNVICEYLEETQPQPLHARDTFARAQQRAWCEIASASIGDVFQFYTAPDEAACRRKAADLKARMQRLDKQLADRPQAGDYFAGTDFCLVDAAFAPIFRLFETFDRLGDFGIFADAPRVQAYRLALAARPSVQQAVVPDYAVHFRAYLRRQGSYLAGLVPA